MEVKAVGAFSENKNAPTVFVVFFLFCGIITKICVNFDLQAKKIPFILCVGGTMEQNFEIAKNMDCLKCFNLPVLVGISRKSMVQFATKTNANTALNGTTALNSFLLSKGANILRVHDTKEAKEVISIYKCINDL